MGTAPRYELRRRYRRSGKRGPRQRFRPAVAPGEARRILILPRAPSLFHSAIHQSSGYHRGAGTDEQPGRSPRIFSLVPHCLPFLNGPVIRGKHKATARYDQVTATERVPVYRSVGERVEFTTSGRHRRRSGHNQMPVLSRQLVASRRLNSQLLPVLLTTGTRSVVAQTLAARRWSRYGSSPARAFPGSAGGSPPRDKTWMQE